MRKESILNKRKTVENMCGGNAFNVQHLGGRSQWISMSLRPALSTYGVLGQPGLHSETLSQKGNLGREVEKREQEGRKGGKEGEMTENHGDKLL